MSPDTLSDIKFYENMFTGYKQKKAKMKLTIYYTIALLTLSTCTSIYAQSTSYILPTIKVNFDATNNEHHTTSGIQDYAPVMVQISPQYTNQPVEQAIAQNSWVQSSNTSSANPTFNIKAQRATVSLNGIPLNQFNSQAQNIALIPTPGIQSIEVLPQASSVLYGSMGIGGIINIQQRFLQRDQYIIGSSLSYPFGGGINFFINQLLDHDKTWDLQLSGITQTTDSYRDYSRNFNNATNITLMHKTNKQSLNINFSDSYQYLQFPGALTQEEVDQDPWQASSGKEKYINHTLNTQISWALQIKKPWKFQLDSQYQQQWANAIFDTTSAKQTSSLLYLRPSIIYQKNKIKNQFGSDITHQTFTQSATTPSSSQTNFALFNQFDLMLTQTWQSEIGGRFEHSYTQGTFSTGKSGDQTININAGNMYLQYNWHANFHTRISVDYAYQLPFIDQSNYTPNNTSEFGLQPQTAWTYQLDNRFHNNHLSLTNSLYLMNIHNQIAYAGDQSSGVYGKNINLPPTQTIGSLFDIEYHITKNNTIGGSFALNYNTFTNGMLYPSTSGDKTLQPVKGNEVPGQPPFTAELHTKINLTSNIRLWLQEQYNSQMYVDGDFTNSLGKQGAYFLTNIMLDYQLQDWHFNLSIYNLFNKFYYAYASTSGFGQKYFYPANGINGALSISYTFQ
ncbi:TonB-dependent receptor [Facilibium subflavum]|uniref:TonB-dependent receptor n=1 Tax=Facilibium subflavum TaxID=2219058 RepID=UPI0013C3779F|nr:TonB-dependent receptor [Facilibium subflavum]